MVGSGKVSIVVRIHDGEPLPPAPAVGSLCYHACMSKPSDSPIHYTIRGIPPEVDRALRLKAARRKQSLNRVVLDELTRALVGRPIKADFSDLVGKWTPDPAFDEIVASQRQIDVGKWEDDSWK